MSAEAPNAAITADAGYFEAHPDSLELWSPGSPLFPDDAALAEGGEGDVAVRVRVADLLEQSRAQL